MGEENLEVEKFEFLIIGGGIVGAGIFRDLGLHQKKCLLIDKGDFAAQTSQSSSKMLHGGIRYLENMDFKLVYEALHEKNFWLKNAPHLCKEVPFYLPVFKESNVSADVDNVIEEIKAAFMEEQDRLERISEANEVDE